MRDNSDGLVLLAPGEEPVLVIDYTNHRGERSKRRIRPWILYWGKTDWHPEPCLLLSAYDVEKGAPRDFAVKDIHGVERAPESET